MATINQFPVQLVDGGNFTTVIASGQTSSSVLFCGGASAIGLMTDSNFTSCNITFSVSLTGQGNFKSLKDPSGNGSAITLALSSDNHMPLDPSIFSGIKYVQVICDTPQSVATSLTFILGPVWES